MNILDIIIILCCCPLLISGYKKGFVNQVISIIILMAGVWIASGLANVVGGWISPLISDKCENPAQIAYVVGFALSFVVACIVLFLCGKLVEKGILYILPDIVNKLLGLAMGVVNAVLLLCTLYLVFEVLNKIYFFVDMKEAFFSDSMLFPIIESTTNAILPNILNIFI